METVAIPLFTLLAFIVLAFLGGYRAGQGRLFPDDRRADS